MLKFIIGRAGTGKTSALLELMRAGLEAGNRRIIYLVPEQYSFEAERQVVRRFGQGAALNVEVLSFTRLCDSVFRALGGLAGVPLTDTARYLLMSVAVEEVADRLSVYRKSAARTAFLETLIAACGEFKSAGITGAALGEFAERLPRAGLKDKLQELALLYAAYQSLIERGYADPDDDQIRACALLENNAFFEGALVFVDGFATFMAGEFELLGHVIAQSKEVTFAFTADGVLDRQRGLGVFSAAKQAMARLTRLAEQRDVPVAGPVLLNEYKKYNSPEIIHIASCLMEPAPGEFAGRYTGAVTVRGCTDAYAELDAVAADIARLTRENGYRYSEIGVVARNPERFSRAIDSAFSRRDIPYFMSLPRDVENSPLAAGVLAALNAVRSGFDASQALMFAKSPLLGLDASDAALLENYCYCWDIRGALWHADFTGNPRGLAGALTQADTERLKVINAAREKVTAPLLRLREGLRGADGAGFATAVFGLLEDINAAENLQSYARGTEAGEEALAESARLWDALMDILDVFGTALKSRKTPTARLCELFRLALSSAGTASPPQTLDQVIVGGADRLRPEKLRAVFVIGVNENEFPAMVKARGVFSEGERGELIDAGLMLSGGGLARAALEKYFAYFALTLPSERLELSYSRCDLSGRELLPSSVISQIAGMFPDLPPPPADALEGVSNRGSGLDALARDFSGETALGAALREYYLKTGYIRLARLAAATEGETRRIEDEELAGRLFGNGGQMTLSPSRVERYFKCPFQYFARDGLKLQRRERVRFTGLEYGSAVHHVLQAMLQRHSGAGLAGLSDRQLADEVAEIIREYLAGLTDGAEGLSRRFTFLFERLCGMFVRLLRRLGQEFSQSGFVPYALELPIEKDGPVEPLRLLTPEGTSVRVEGRVDRVDVMNKNGRRYVRVVDYKSGAKTFSLADVLYGLNLQMLLYLFTIAANGKDGLEDATPAGVLYMPASERYLSALRTTDDDALRAQRQKNWRMSGLLLDDEEALRGMEPELAGVFIPAKQNKDGRPDASSHIAAAAEFARLGRKLERLITGMAQRLCKGGIEAVPLEESTGAACDFCDYGAVCGYERGEPSRRVNKVDRREFFKILEEEENDAEQSGDGHELD